MTEFNDPADRAERRAYVEDKLGHYPDIDKEELADLLKWFRKEATSLDVGMIASDSKLGEKYQLIKADHLARFGLSDLLWFIGFFTIGGGLIALIFWAGS